MIGLVNVAFFFQRRYWPAKPELEGSQVAMAVDGIAMTEDIGCPTVIGGHGADLVRPGEVE